MKKAFGFGDSILLQINETLKEDFRKEKILYKHLICEDKHVDLNVAKDCNIGPLTRLNLYVDDLIFKNETYDFVVVHLGLHDIKVKKDMQHETDLDLYERTFLKVIESLSHITQRIYWCAIPYIFDDHHNQRNLGFARYVSDAHTYNMHIKENIKHEQFVWIDTFQCMESMSKSYLIDHVHLNPEGIKLYASYIVKEITNKETNDET